MAMEVVKVDLKTVQDASTLDAGIRNEQFSADQVYRRGQWRAE